MPLADHKATVAQVTTAADDLRQRVLRMPSPLRPNQGAPIMSSLRRWLPQVQTLVDEGVSTYPRSLVTDGYALLDELDPYRLLAAHFFSKDVQSARLARTSDV